MFLGVKWGNNSPLFSRLVSADKWSEKLFFPWCPGVTTGVGAGVTVRQCLLWAWLGVCVCVWDAEGGWCCCMRHIECVCAGRCRTQRLVQSGCCIAVVTAGIMVKRESWDGTGDGAETELITHSSTAVVCSVCCLFGCSVRWCLLIISAYIISLLHPPSLFKCLTQLYFSVTDVINTVLQSVILTLIIPILKI